MLLCTTYRIEKQIQSLNNPRLNKWGWYVLRLFLNCVLPVYYRLSKPNYDNQMGREQYTDKQVILSLTSFPERIGKIHLVLESLLRQTVRPDRIILWLASSQFEKEDPRVARLKRTYGAHIDIRYCEDIKSHKKYFFAMQQYPDACIVTADDDVFYSENTLEQLLETYKDNPGCIVAMRAHQITLKDGEIQPYKQWNCLARDMVGPSLYLCPTGAGGCLYPPHCLSLNVFDMGAMKELCLYADDLWLKCMSFVAGTRVVLTGKNNPEIIDLLGTKRTGLTRINVAQNYNDIQLRAVSERYAIHWDQDYTTQH